jgi:hypothetical protein
MTVLTWRDVDAPDFRGSMDGLELASKSMNAGLNAARGGLDDVEKRQKESQSTALLAELAKYQDADSLQADLASGAFQSKFDMSKLDPADLRTVMSRPTEILAFAKDKTAFGQVQKAVADDDRFRALEPVINEYRQLAQDDPTGAKAAAFRNSHPELRGMSSSDFNGLLNTSLKASEAQFGHSKDVTTFEQGQGDRDTGLQASKLDGYLTGIVAPEDRLRYINTNRAELEKSYSGRAIDMILKQASGDVGGAPGSGGGVSGGTGIGAGGKNLYDVVLGDGQGAGGGNAYGFSPPKPVSQMSMGELFDYQRSVMVPTTAAKGVGGGQGSSAAGAYQIVSRTLEKVAPRLFGANWRQVQFTPENQDKLGEALFNDAKASGQDLHAVWEGLPVGTKATNLNWAEARHMITQAESGGTVLANPRSLQIAGNVTNQLNNTSPVAQGAIKFQELKSDGSQARAVAQRMTGKEGLFAGQDIGNMTQKINEVAKEYKINPAMAGFLIEQADNGNKNWLGRQFTWAPGNDGLTVDIDSDRLAELAKAYSDPKTLADATISVDASNRAQAANAQTQAQVDALVAQRTAIIQRAAQRGIQPDTTLIDRQLTAALGGRDQAAINGAVTATSGQTSRTGDDGVAAPVPIARRPATPPHNQAPLILANNAGDQSKAPWAQKALATAAKAKSGKPLTAAEFAAAMAAQAGKKSLLSR